ncbi:MAG: PIN domain-containing protein [Alphaproteobacteria bacterium]|nr:PIN domain-containing protein [Alphaproteobacteria bacterium]MBV8407307.1 PIN domain-containing protein [Alphaproteobacteria bacterium]
MGAIVDTGPIVALLDRSDRHHDWAKDRFVELRKPLFVCEAVLAEAMFLLRNQPVGQDALFELTQGDVLDIAFQIREHIALIRNLLRKYRDVPMSLADACIVRMAEINEGSPVLTFDSDFLIYRKQGRTPLAVIHPTIA